MRIGFDIDNVILDTFASFLNYYNQKFNLGISLDQLTSYYIWEIGIGGSREESIRFLDDYLDSVGLEVPFVEGAEQSVRDLARDNDVYFISSRFDRHKVDAEKFIKIYFPRLVNRSIFTNDFSGVEGRNKSQVCEDFEIDVYVEDHFDYALDCASKGIKVLLLNYPWNKNRTLPENIRRVYNWQEICERIEEVRENGEY